MFTKSTRFKQVCQLLLSLIVALMKQNGVYPYDYMDSFDKFGDQQLPPKDSFYSILPDEGISDVQYQHAQNVWNTFNMNIMGDYHDLYLQSNILLLADEFENFYSIINWIPVTISHLLGYPRMLC